MNTIPSKYHPLIKKLIKKAREDEAKKILDEFFDLHNCERSIMTGSISDFLRDELLDQKARETRLIENEQEFRKTMGDKNYEKDREYQTQWINCIRHLQDQYRRNYLKYPLE